MELFKDVSIFQGWKQFSASNGKQYRVEESYICPTIKNIYELEGRGYIYIGQIVTKYKSCKKIYEAMEASGIV